MTPAAQLRADRELTSLVPGQTGRVWFCLVKAGQRGVTAAALLRQAYAGIERPRSGAAAIRTAIRRCNGQVERHGYAVATVPGALPTRWRVERIAAAAAAPSDFPNPTIRAVRTPRFAVLTGLTGAPAAIAGAARCTCHWPFGHPSEPDFRFCGAAAVIGRPYCAEHGKQASAAVRKAA